jgi:Icc protein
MRIGIVSDIHHGPISYSKRGDVALGLLADALAAIREAGAELVIDLGDRISDVDLPTDRRLLAEVAEVFADCGLPRHHVNGNHDRCHLSADDNDAALGQPIGTSAIDLGTARLVLWQPDVHLTVANGLTLADGDLDALSAALAASDARTILASHVPLTAPTMTGNYWFENNRRLAAYRETDAIRAVLAAAPCPLLAVSGHVHWNTLTTVDGTSHITCQSLSESYTTHPHACGAYALLDLGGDEVSWHVFGKDPFAAIVPFPARKSRWLAPLPGFIAAEAVER